MTVDGSPAERLGDAPLLAALGLGDPDAAVVFVRRFQRQVFGVAYAMCGDGRLAEDLAQQTFERAWRHAASYDPRLGSVRTWLLTICRRLAIDALRLRRSSPVDPQVVGALLPPDRATGPEEDAVLTDQVERLRGGLAALPEAQRRAVLLATLGGHTAAEIALFEQVPIGTAKTRLRQGLRRLRDGLTVEERAGA